MKQSVVVIMARIKTVIMRQLLPALMGGVWGWVFFLLPTTLQADILKGRVVDAETKEPLPEATL